MEDDDALLDRLAKGLEAIRRDADLARSGGAQGVAAALARTEAELHILISGIEELRQRGEQQQTATSRLVAAVAKHEADLKGLRQTVETLSHRMREQAEALDVPSAWTRPPSAAAPIVIALAVLLLGGAAVVWIVSGREPTVATLADRLVERVSDLSGIDLAGRGAPPGSLRTEAPPNPRSVQQSLAAPAPTDVPVPAAPASAAAPSDAASIAPASAETPAATASALTTTTAPPPAPTTPTSPAQTTGTASPPTQTTTTAMSPAQTSITASSPAQTSAIASSAAQTSATVVSPAQARTTATSPAQTSITATSPAQMATVLPPMTPTATSNGQSATPTPNATAPAASSHAPPAIHHLILRATADTWVQVRQKGGRFLLRRIMKDGETWPVPSDPDLLLDSGNAGGLELDLDGVPLKLAGAKGTVIRDVSLGAELLVPGPIRPAH